MGLYTDFIAHSTLIDKTEQQEGPQRITYNELLRHQARLDAATPAAFGALDAVQVINAFTPTVASGNYTITIVDELGTSHTTANLVFSDVAATIESAIDTKMTADSYASWTNGDISVALTGNLTANAATLTFDGASVTEKNMGQATVANVDLAGAGTVNGATTDTQGITTNEVQTVNVFVATVSGGNYTITIVDELAASHTTANIAYDAVQAAIEGAIDTIMTSDAYGGWTNGDITVALTGDLTANSATLTYDGDSVTGKDMGQVTVADVDLTGGGTVNGATTGTPGITTNEVQTVNTFTPTVSGGNFTLNIVDEVAGSHVTANIAYDATAAEIETAIDVKMTTDAYSGWTNGDISVALTGGLAANDATLTFDGDSVTGVNMGQATLADVDLTDSGGINGQSETTSGQAQRYAWAVMWAHGMVASPPAQGDLLTPDALDVTPASSTAHWPSASLRKILAWQAGLDDDNVALRAQLETLFKVA